MPTVKRVDFDLNSMAEIDGGKINRLLRSHVQRVAHDCADRPNDKNKRKIVIEITAEPVPTDDGFCDHVNVQIRCRSRLPDYRSRPYPMEAGNSGFSFNKEFPADRNAVGLPFDESESLSKEDE